MTGMYHPEMDAARLPVAFLMSLSHRENLSEMELLAETNSILSSPFRAILICKILNIPSFCAKLSKSIRLICSSVHLKYSRT